MKNNYEYKDAGKELLRSNYWNYVVAAFLTLALSGIVIGNTASVTWSDRLRLSGSFSLLWLIVMGPLEVGVCGYFMGYRRGYRVELAELFSGFKGNVGARVGAGILVSVFSFLWTLLFIVPGIIKSLSYAMTPYILKDHPEMGAMEAIRYSQKMMQGKKGKLFSLYLSYLGWYILGALTGGILYIFYVTPWVRAAVTEFYEDAKETVL